MISLFKKVLSLRGARFLLFIPLVSILASCFLDDDNDDGGATTERAFSQSFVTTWKTDNAGLGNDLQVVIPADSNSYVYNFNVDWGDDTTSNSVTQSTSHTYDEAGTYTITISGEFPRITFQGETASLNEKLLSVNQWGDQKWQSMTDAFAYSPNLTISATDTPDLSETTSMQRMFYAASSLNQDLSQWDVSAVTDMRWVFTEASSFNQNLNSWNVSAVTKMKGMFYDAVAFNQDISSWDVSSVTDMAGMFHTASAFNQDISAWNVSSVTNMDRMFHKAAAFNQDISVWDITSVSNTNEIFRESGLSHENLDLINHAWDL